MLKWKPDGTARCGRLALRSGELEQSGTRFAAVCLSTPLANIDLYWERATSVLAAQLAAETWLRKQMLDMSKDLEVE